MGQGQRGQGHHALRDNGRGQMTRAVARGGNHMSEEARGSARLQPASYPGAERGWRGNSGGVEGEGSAMQWVKGMRRGDGGSSSGHGGGAPVASQHHTMRHRRAGAAGDERLARQWGAGHEAWGWGQMEREWCWSTRLQPSSYPEVDRGVWGGGTAVVGTRKGQRGMQSWNGAEVKHST